MKHNNITIKKTVLICLIIVCVIMLVACDGIEKQVREEAVIKLAKQILGDDAEISFSYHPTTPTPNASGTTDTSQNANSTPDPEGDLSWPDEIPSNVPQTGLDISKRIKTPNGYIIDFGEIDITQVNAYTEMLESFDYSVIKQEVTEKKIDAIYKKDETTINVYWYKDGVFSLMVTWQ